MTRITADVADCLYSDLLLSMPWIKSDDAMPHMCWFAAKPQPLRINNWLVWPTKIPESLVQLGGSTSCCAILVHGDRGYQLKLGGQFTKLAFLGDRRHLRGPVHATALNGDVLSIISNTTETELSITNANSQHSSIILFFGEESNDLIGAKAD